MHTINVRKIGDRLYEKIKSESKRSGISMNSYILQTLTDVLEEKKVEFHDLDHFFGTWNGQDTLAIDHVLSDSRQIDDELWK